MDSPQRVLRVLVVDDCEDHVGALALLLRYWGHQPLCAYDGPGAMEMALAHRPEVAVLDLEMPGGVDGWELARRLRERPQTGTIILVALTGCTRAQDRRRCQEVGFDHFLLKPADPDELKWLLAGFASGLAVAAP